MKKKLFSALPVLRGERVTLRALTAEDAPALGEMRRSPAIYRTLPTFLFERKYADADTVIARLYDECLRESLILGVFINEGFCGLAEFYGFRDPIHKVSVGYRFAEDFWGMGLATETLGVMLDYLFGETDIEIVTASTMVENAASAHVLIKNGFSLVAHAVYEDWGYEHPTLADKWIR